jgi:hypothetical protein
MGGLKTFLAALAVAFPYTDTARADENLVRTFASCAGRLSAEMEHQWLIGGENAELTERRRNAMIAVLDALAPDQRDPKIMNWRIEAKMAQASLLSRSIFNDDTADADWAYRQAQTLVSACNSLILG